MRELTHNEMKKVMDAALAALPKDINAVGVIIVFTVDTPKGDWINRISNMSRSLTNQVLVKWGQWITTRKNFGETNQN